MLNGGNKDDLLLRLRNSLEVTKHISNIFRKYRHMSRTDLTRFLP